MKKIKFKISYNCLQTICNLYDAVTETHSVNPQEYHFNKEYKAHLSIITLTFEKLKVTLVKKDKNCKPFTLAIAYYQAYYFILFLRANVHYFTGDYEKSITYLLATEIDQKL